jgi:hypothetical protein
MREHVCLGSVASAALLIGCSGLEARAARWLPSASEEGRMPYWLAPGQGGHEQGGRCDGRDLGALAIVLLLQLGRLADQRRPVLGGREPGPL